MNESEDGIFVRIRGLPWSATEEDVVKFLSDCRLARGISSVFFTFTKDGRPSGEAYVELASEEDKERACKHNNQHMGKRYIEVFPSRRTEMEYVVKRSGPQREESRGDAVLRLRGLPFGCTKEEIAQFFAGYEIIPNGITLVIDHQGRTAGDAYVQFATQDIAEMASSKHMERIGHRYIEIFKSCLSDAQSAMSHPPGPFSGSRSSRPGPYDRQDRYSGGGSQGPRSGSYGGGGGRGIKGLMEDEMGGGYRERGARGDGNFDSFSRGGSRGEGSPPRRTHSRSGGRSTHTVHMRGMPFQATERDIADFLRPLNPVDIVLHFNNSRSTGEADVYFATHDEACEAMKRDKCNMHHRYVELFLNSTPSRRMPSPVRPVSRGYDGAPATSSFSDGSFYGGGGGGGNPTSVRPPSAGSTGNWGGGGGGQSSPYNDNYGYGRSQPMPSQGYGGEMGPSSGSGYGGGSGFGGGSGYSGGNGYGGGSNYVGGGNDYNPGGGNGHGGGNGSGGGFGGYNSPGNFRGSSTNNYAAF